MKFICKYTLTNPLIISKMRGQESERMDTAQVFIEAETEAEARQKCKKSFGEPISILKFAD